MKIRVPFGDLFVVCSASVFMVLLMMLVPSLGMKTTDDKSLLANYLNRGMYSRDFGSVLGASSNNDPTKRDLCPTDKPIIGWLDYEGNLIIKDKLDLGQKPTVCFATREEALNSGFREE